MGRYVLLLCLGQFKGLIYNFFQRDVDFSGDDGKRFIFGEVEYLDGG